MAGDGDDTTVTLGSDIYARVEKRADQSEFDDVSEYVEYVLDSLLTELEGQSESAEDDEEVRERLRELGYLE
ncbi:CopG family transcriptional regulator [Halovenus sp. WSH3]|uniref:CopG family transcriptional regulator n=1 Tax=Halovenus carboxidivorans TaxID=2692199 RepID=A0A6B0T6U5_9EURY|nr:CopG family transcriptional regulator [Halovenus carboxidivorans]MXR50992.1 CopG family transcriptional regulator [Halovenus carboxidivorans]